MKRREHNVHADVLVVLLSLRIKDVNLDKEKEDELQQKKFKGRKMKLLSMSKKERKVRYLVVIAKIFIHSRDQGYLCTYFYFVA